MKIGAQVRIFNYVMRERRAEFGWTQQRLADESQVQLTIVIAVERLTLPSAKLSTIRDSLNRIARALDLPFDSVFPQEYLDAIQAKMLPRRRVPMTWVREVRMSELSARTPDLVLPDPEDLFLEESKLRTDMEKSIANLSEQEQVVLKMRFGLFGEREHTLEEVGHVYGVTRERVRQIEAKALRALRTPRITHVLQRWIDERE